MAKKKSPVTVTDNSAKVLSRYEKATMGGIDDVMADCVQQAIEDAPFATGALAGGIAIHHDARKEEGDEIAGMWGSHDVFYALAVETGDREYLKDLPKRESTAGMNRKETTLNKGRRNFMRGATDIYYPQLGDRIQDHLGPPVL